MLEVGSTPIESAARSALVEKGKEKQRVAVKINALLSKDLVKLPRRDSNPRPGD